MLGASASPKARVLVVEDEAIIAEDIRARLTRLGYQVVGIADSGAQALQLASLEKPELVFMDIIIQGPLDGVRTAAELKRRMDLPVIFLTALSDTATLERVKDFGPHGFVVKPFVEHDLHIAAELALHRHRGELQERQLRLAEQEQQATLSLVNATLDALEARVAILDDTGMILATNRAWREGASVAGASLAATCEGQNYLSVCDRSDEGKVVAEGLRALISGELERFGSEYACHFEQSRGFWSCTASRFMSGAQTRLVVAHHNVTQVKLSELARAESERRYRQVLDAISDLVVVSAPESRLVLANKAFRETHGLTAGAGGASLSAPPPSIEAFEHLLAEDARVFLTGESLDLPNDQIRTKGGHLMHLHTVKTPIFDADGSISMVVSVSRDITEHKRLESQLRLADRMASVGTLASGVAHEINTPVQFVNDSVHFVRGAVGDLITLFGRVHELRQALLDGRSPESVVRELDEAEESVDLSYLLENMPRALERSLDGLERIATIVRSMREFAHPDQKEMQAADLNRSIINTLTIARSELKYVADEELSLGELPQVLCHAGDINQVLLNLIVNATHAMADTFKATGQRGTLRVQTFVEGSDVVIAISDTGGGIPESIRDRIFDPFFTTKEVGKGTGQGLPISRHIVVEKHGGSLTFDSQTGLGTTFFVRLPVLGRAPVSL